MSSGVGENNSFYGLKRRAYKIVEFQNPNPSLRANAASTLSLQAFGAVKNKGD
jgi:hypothetical protein